MFHAPIKNMRTFFKSVELRSGILSRFCLIFDATPQNKSDLEIAFSSICFSFPMAVFVGRTKKDRSFLLRIFFADNWKKNWYKSKATVSHVSGWMRSPALKKYGSSISPYCRFNPFSLHWHTEYDTLLLWKRTRKYSAHSAGGDISRMPTILLSPLLICVSPRGLTCAAKHRCMWIEPNPQPLRILIPTRF